MKTKTTIKFDIVEDIDGNHLVLRDNQGKLPALLTDRVELSDEQKALWQDYTGEKDGTPYHWGEAVSQEEITNRIAELVASRSRDHSQGKRKDSFHVFLFRYTLQSVVVNPDEAPADLIEALRAHSSGRGNRDAHCCVTGKDADLESHGQQDITIDGILNGFAECTVTVGKTFAGSDVSLNLPENLVDEEFIEKAIDAWLDQAQEVICGCGVAGEWDGDSWYCHEGVGFRVKLRATTEETAKAIVKKAEQAIAPLEKELRIADEILNNLSGWTDGRGNPYPAGKPGEGSIGHYLAHKDDPFPSEEDLDWQAHNQEGK